MQVKHVSNQELGNLRPPTQQDIQRSIATAQWTPAQKQAHTNNMQQLDRKAMQFVRMQQAQKQAPAKAQRPPPAAAGKATPRHNSVARNGYTSSRTGATQRPPARASPSHVPAYANVAAARQRNMQRANRMARRQAVRQRAVAGTKNAVRTMGNMVRPQRTMQTVKGALMAGRNRIQQANRQAAQQRRPQPQRKEQSRGQTRAR